MAEQPRKRKQRGSAVEGTGGAPKRSGRDAMTRGYAKAEQKNQEAREALVPLAEGERPTVVTIGAVLTALVVISILVGYLAGVKVDGERPKVPQVLAPALLLGFMSWGMWKARYWAVLGFQLVLIFLMLSAAYGLMVTATTVAQFAVTGALLVVTSVLFFFMVKAMARIQMPQRMPPE